MSLSINVINKLNNLFNEKKWKITGKKNDLYSRFCERLNFLEEEEDQLFVIDLAKDFLCVGEFQRIYEDIQNVFFNIDEEVYELFDKIVIMPLSKKIYKPDKKTKSGEAYFYFFKRSNFFSWFDYYPNKFMFSEEMRGDFIRDNKAIFFIDDYVGSGDTFIEIYNDIKEIYAEINPRNIFVLAPFSQEKAVKRIYDEVGARVISETIRNRGISDRYPAEKVPIYLDKMIKIENRIDKKIEEKDCSLGYKQSEALIQVLYKTPNNTFPVFWFENKQSLSPFPIRTPL